MRFEIDESNLNELEIALDRSERLLRKLRSWETGRSWVEARKIIDEIPLRIFSFEERESLELFVSEDVVTERKRKLGVEDYIGPEGVGADLFVEFVVRQGDRDTRKQRAEIKKRLIEDARYYGKSISGPLFKSELEREYRSKAPKLTPETLIKEIFSGKRRLDSGFLNELIDEIRAHEAKKYFDDNPDLYKDPVRMYFVHNPGSKLFSDPRDPIGDFGEAVCEIMRFLVRSKKVNLSLSELGIESERVIPASVEQIVTTRPILNKEVYDLIANRLETEIPKFREKLENFLTTSSPSGIQLPFEIFPVGDWEIRRISREFRKCGISMADESINRLETIRQTFLPDKIAVGKLDSRGYEGYFVFIFEKVSKVIAENPLYGNATYVIRGEWNEILDILKLTKSEVRQHPRARYVIHRDKEQWIRDLKSNFR